MLVCECVLCVCVCVLGIVQHISGKRGVFLSVFLSVHPLCVLHIIKINHTPCVLNFNKPGFLASAKLLPIGVFVRQALLLRFESSGELQIIAFECSFPTGIVKVSSPLTSHDDSQI